MRHGPFLGQFAYSKYFLGSPDPFESDDDNLSTPPDTPLSSPRVVLSTTVPEATISSAITETTPASVIAPAMSDTMIPEDVLSQEVHNDVATGPPSTPQNRSPSPEPGSQPLAAEATDQLPVAPPSTPPRRKGQQRE